MCRGVFFCCQAVSEPARAEGTCARAATSLAPADEYFGRLRMSVLGIRNLIGDLGGRYAGDNAEGFLRRASFVQDAIRDWECKYPADTAIPQTLLSLNSLYQKIDLDEARVRGVETEWWLLSRYRESSAAKDVLQRLADRDASQAQSSGDAEFALPPRPTPSNQDQ